MNSDILNGWISQEKRIITVIIIAGEDGICVIIKSLDINFYM